MPADCFMPESIISGQRYEIPLPPRTASRPVPSNPTKSQPGWAPVIVAGAYQTGIVLMRNLSRRGVEVSCIDNDLKMPGFKTVYGKAYHCPDPEKNPAAWVEFMRGLSRQLGSRPVLIPSSDRFITVLGDYAGELEPYFIFPRASVAAQALLATKQRQYHIAGEYGLPVPRTEFVESLEQLAAFADGARFPCLLKPIHFMEWRRFPKGHPLHYEKVTVADSKDELLAAYRLAAPVTPEIVVQEVIQGPDTAKLVYLSCYGSGGDRLGYCVLRQVRTDPIYFGSASVVEPVSDPEADRICDRFLRNLGYVGLCEIELKRDVRDGKLMMIEANPRYSVTADAAPYLGVDLGWLHYLDLIGQPVTPAEPEIRDFRHIVLRRDAAAFRSYMRAGLLNWKDFARSYRSPVRFFDFDPYDWRVTSAALLDITKLLLKSWFRNPR